MYSTRMCSYVICMSLAGCYFFLHVVTPYLLVNILSSEKAVFFSKKPTIKHYVTEGFSVHYKHYIFHSVLVSLQMGFFCLFLCFFTKNVHFFEFGNINSQMLCLHQAMEDSRMICHDGEMWDRTHCNQPVHLSPWLQLLCRCLHNIFPVLKKTERSASCSVATGNINLIFFYYV